jgi:hypothetical protein
MAIITSFQPWYQFCTAPIWDFPLNTDQGPDDLVKANVNQATFTMTFSAKGVDTLGTGTFTVKFTSPAEVLYQPSNLDVAAPFSGQLFIKAQTLDNPVRTIVWDPVPFVISAS